MWVRVIDHMLTFLLTFHPADTFTGWAQIFNASLNHVSVQFAVPTDEMLAYASLATLGDDVYFEPSTAYVRIIISSFSAFDFDTPALEH